LIFKPEAIALFGRGFDKAAELSDGKLVVVGAVEMAVLTDNDKFISRQIEEWVIQGYYKSWHSVMNDLVREILTPVAMMRLLESSLALVDMYEELGLGVFHRHAENDARWHATCESYRMQINAYLK
jgi:hypothetical protein